MIALHKQVVYAIDTFKSGQKKDSFIPHITIGRTTQSYGNIDVLPFLEHVYYPRELDVNCVTLYESQLLSEGAKYKVLTEFPLN